MQGFIIRNVKGHVFSSTRSIYTIHYLTYVSMNIISSFQVVSHTVCVLPCFSSHKPTNLFHFPCQVITYFAGRVFDPSEAERGHVAFAGEYLKGDASLLISDLSLTDSGEYSCKVKTGAQYHWSTISLIVLGKWQTANSITYHSLLQ